VKKTWSGSVVIMIIIVVGVSILLTRPRGEQKGTLQLDIIDLYHGLPSMDHDVYMEMSIKIWKIDGTREWMETRSSPREPYSAYRYTSGDKLQFSYYDEGHNEVFSREWVVPRVSSSTQFYFVVPNVWI